VNDRPTGDVEIATDDMISRRHFPARLLELSAACTRRPCRFVLEHGHFIALSTTGRQKQVSARAETDDKASPRGIRLRMATGKWAGQ